MPDISMCFGEGCERREKCYRYTATPNPYRQAYADFMKTPQPCEHFVPNEDATDQNATQDQRAG